LSSSVENAEDIKFLLQLYQEVDSREQKRLTGKTSTPIYTEHVAKKLVVHAEQKDDVITMFALFHALKIVFNIKTRTILIRLEKVKYHDASNDWIWMKTIHEQDFDAVQILNEFEASYQKTLQHREKFLKDFHKSEGKGQIFHVCFNISDLDAIQVQIVKVESDISFIWTTDCFFVTDPYKTRILTVPLSSFIFLNGAKEYKRTKRLLS
jgi:hypothetical protein